MCSLFLDLRLNKLFPFVLTDMSNHTQTALVKYIYREGMFRNTKNYYHDLKQLGFFKGVLFYLYLLSMWSYTWVPFLILFEF